MLPREQANFLRQLLTTLREWGEEGRQTLRYLFAAYAGWLDAFDQELARALSEAKNEAGEDTLVTDQYIDIFYNSSDPHTPYHAWVWHARRVVERGSYLHLADAVAFCNRVGLPVVSSTPELRADLRTHGIEARAGSGARELGSQTNHK